MTSATSQSEDGVPDRCQSASVSSSPHSKCTERLLEDPAGSQYLNIYSRTLKSHRNQLKSDNSEGMMSLTRSGHTSLRINEVLAAELNQAVKHLTSSQSHRNLQQRQKFIDSLHLAPTSS